MDERAGVDEDDDTGTGSEEALEFTAPKVVEGTEEVACIDALEEFDAGGKEAALGGGRAFVDVAIAGETDGRRDGWEFARGDAEVG